MTFNNFNNIFMILFVLFRMKNITYKEIATALNKSEGTIKNWSKNHPILLEYVKIGAFSKKNELDINQIKKLIDIKNAISTTDK